MIESQVLKQEVKRIWILGDMHLGVRANSMEWLEIQKEFYEKEFIPTLKKHSKPGDILVQVGDVFDNRQALNIKIMDYAIRLFEKLGSILPVHVICGNHDIWSKNSNEITSIDCLKWIPNIQIYKDPVLYIWSGKRCLLMPWRVDADHEIETLSNYPGANLLFCHSEVRGAWLNSKVQTHHGVDVSVYQTYETVYSGHLHYRQNKGKLKFIGTPYELTRSDMGNQKGFFCLDLQTGEETFYQNQSSPRFVKFELINIFNLQLGDFKKMIQNNFVDLLIPSELAASNQLGQLMNRLQGISRKIEPHVYDETEVQIQRYDQAQIEEIYKNYNILSLCNLYVDKSLATHAGDTQSRIKNKLKDLYSQHTRNNLEQTE